MSLHSPRFTFFILRLSWDWYSFISPMFLCIHASGQLMASDCVAWRTESCLNVGEWWCCRSSWKKTHRSAVSVSKCRYSCYAERYHLLQSQIDHQLRVQYPEYCWPSFQRDCQLPLLVAQSGTCRQYTCKTNRYIYLVPSRSLTAMRRTMRYSNTPLTDHST